MKSLITDLKNHRWSSVNGEMVIKDKVSDKTIKLDKVRALSAVRFGLRYLDNLRLQEKGVLRNRIKKLRKRKQETINRLRIRNKKLHARLRETKQKRRDELKEPRKELKRRK